MQLKGMACHPIKLEINVVGGGVAEDMREKNLACLQCLRMRKLDDSMGPGNKVLDLGEAPSLA